MPELPEVETVRAGLAPAIIGAVIEAVEVFEPRSLRRHDATGGGFESMLSGASVAAAVRRGKFLWFPLSGDGAARERALVAHLGMSGQLLLRGVDAAPERHARVRLSLSHPHHGELAVDFVDQRIFGWLAVDALLPTLDGAPGGDAGVAGPNSTSISASMDASGENAWECTLPSLAAHIARDPLDAAFSEEAFRAGLARTRRGIKAALLDQGLASGIGNIYADEALWAARIHFEQPACSLSRRRVDTLLAEIRGVLARALVDGGTSFDAQYVNVNGAAGYFSRQLRVYGLAGQPCERCGTPIVREKFMNRSSHFCPVCQRKR